MAMSIPRFSRETNNQPGFESELSFPLPRLQPRRRSPSFYLQTLGERERERELEKFIILLAKIDKPQKVPQKALKKAILRALRKSAPLKCLFKPTPHTPADVVRRARFLLMYLDSNSECGGGGGGIKHFEKVESDNARAPAGARALEPDIRTSNTNKIRECKNESASAEQGLRARSKGQEGDNYMIVVNDCDQASKIRKCECRAKIESKSESEVMAELNKLIRELKTILYGNNEFEPAAEACAQLTQEFFSEDTLRLLIICLPKLDLQGRKDATQVVANLQRQQVRYRLMASDYLESNLDLMDHLMSGYEDQGIALHYGTMLRECIRHQSVARYVLNSKCMKRFFDYIQLPNFDVAADAIATFKELLTRHKSTVAEFLSRNYNWFFAEFNSKLLESTNYVTRRQAVKLLGDILLERSNSSVMVNYVSSKDNLRILMNLLREPSKNIQIDAFHVFKLFAANNNKPLEIANILVANRSKILRFFSDFKIDREDEQFEADKAQVIKEIAEVESKEGDLANERLLKTY